MIMGFESVMIEMERLGVWDILLPFMLIFTVTYAVLTSTVSMFSGENKKFATVISMVIALGVVIPHAIGAYPPGGNVVLIINQALPNVALISVAILGLFIILGLFGIELNLNGAPIMGIVVAFSVIAIVYLFGSAGGQRYEVPAFLSFLTHPDTQAMLIVIAVFGGLVWFITRPPKKDDSPGFLDSLPDTLGKISDLFKGGK